MTRLPRSRGGKTGVEVDVVTTRQNGLPRVRLTLGSPYTNNKSTDMDEEETEALIVLLQYKLLELKGET